VRTSLTGYKSIKPKIDEDTFFYLEGCVKAFLKGKNSVSWILGIVKGSDKKLMREIIASIDGDYDRKTQLLFKLGDVK